MNPLAQHFTLLSLLRFAAPSIGMMLTISIFSITDGIFIGRYVGSAALAASNIAFPVLNLIYGLGIMLASGGSALVARTMGEGRIQLAARRFTLITASGFLLGIAFLSFVWLSSARLLPLLGATAHLWDDTWSYLWAMVRFAPFTILMLIFSTFYITDGRPMLGFIVSLVSGLVNVAGDYLLMVVFPLGITGAGLATGAAHVTAAILGLCYFIRHSSRLRFCRFVLEAAVLLRAMGNGSSEMVNQLSVGITTYLFNIITLAWAGEQGVAAISIILYAEFLLTSLLTGFAEGVAPIFSYHFGAGHTAELARLLRLSLTLISVFAIISFITAQLGGASLIAIFVPYDQGLFTLTVSGLTLFSFSFLFCGFNIFGSCFFTALSDGLTSAFLSFIRDLAGISIFLLVLPRFFGINGAWLAVPAADIAALFFTAFFLIRALPIRNRHRENERRIVTEKN